MTAPMAPVPAPQSPPGPVAATPSGPGQDPTQAPAPQDQPQAPAGQDQGGQSATDAAGDDPMAWLTAAEMDTRYQTVDKPMLQTGQVG